MLSVVLLLLCCMSYCHTECRYAECYCDEYRGVVWCGVIRLICTKFTGDYKCMLLA
jgi:hypothetical protein